MTSLREALVSRFRETKDTRLLAIANDLGKINERIAIKRARAIDSGFVYVSPRQALPDDIGKDTYIINGRKVYRVE